MSMKKIFNLTFLISLVVYIIAVMLLPPVFKKFRLEIEQSVLMERKKLKYADLDSDGTSEVIFEDQSNGNNALVYKQNDNYVLEQVNIERPFPADNLFKFADYDADGYKEHYFFTISRDSLYLNAIEFPNLSKFMIKDRFLTTIDENLYGDYDFTVSNIIPSRDINSDGYKELLFSISSGFSFKPRNVYAYDIRNDSLYSYNSGGIFFLPTYFFDFRDGNGEQLLFLSFATDNYRTQKHTTHPDTSAWLLLLNSNTKQAFEPVALGKPGTYVQTAPIQENKTDIYDIFVWQSELKDSKSKCKALIFSTKGELLRSKVFPDLKGSFFVLLPNQNEPNTVLLIDPKGDIYEINHELNATKKNKKLPYTPTAENNLPVVRYADINQNGENEIIVSRDNVLTVFDSSFRHPVSIELQDKKINHFSVAQNTKHEHLISFISEGGIHYLIRYRKDEFYPYRFLIFAVVFLGLYLFFVFIVYLRTRAIRAENKKLELLVAERTCEIEKQKLQVEELNDKLKSSNEKLSERNEQLINNRRYKQMVSTMIVHDLKVPLNTVSRSVSDPLAKNSIEQMLFLIENITDIYRLEEKKMLLNSTTVNISLAIQKLIQHVEPRLRQKNIYTEVSCLQDMCVECDRHLFERIVLNLLSNATKYTPNNGRVHIGFKVQGAGILIEISNTTTESSVENFIPEEKESLGIAKSSGIGLEFCRLALQAHGSELFIRKTKSSEISFSFTLPSAICVSSGNTFQKNESHAVLSDSEVEFLMPFIKKLRALEAYRISDVLKVLADIPKTDSNSINVWRNRMRNAVFAVNEQEYSDLLNPQNKE